MCLLLPWGFHLDSPFPLYSNSGSLISFLSHSTKIPNEIGSKSRRRWRRSNLGRGCLYPRRPNSVGKSSLVLARILPSLLFLCIPQIHEKSMTMKRTKMLQNIIECMPISSMRLGPVGVAGRDCWKVGLLSFACSLAPSLAHHGCCLERPPLVRSVVGYGLALLSLLLHCEGRSPPPTAVRVGLSRVGLALPPRPPRLSLSLSTKTESWPL